MRTDLPLPLHRTVLLITKPPLFRQQLQRNIQLPPGGFFATRRDLEKAQAFIREWLGIFVAQLHREIELLFQLFFKLAEAEGFINRMLHHHFFFQACFAQSVEGVARGMMDVYRNIAMEEPLNLHLQ